MIIYGLINGNFERPSPSRLKELLTAKQRTQLDNKGFTIVFLSNYLARITQEDLIERRGRKSYEA